VQDGPVGWDAFTVFANAYEDACGAHDFFQVDAGSGFRHPTDAEPSGARAHEYQFEIVGEGKPASFRYLDDPVSDNHGVFTIEVRES
jgi:hypothetical protein